jgi:hypothetical protein
MPSVKSIADIKSALLNPATTSHFEVSLDKPSGLDIKYLESNGVNFGINQGKLNLLCSDALLPGSTFTTHDITGDYHGSIHRHAYRRLYDDRIDLSFYVNAEDYLPIRFFETWMKYIAGEQIASSESGRPGISAENYFYRMNYPDQYILKQGLTITKFERSSLGGAKGSRGGTLVYNFVNVFPIALNSMPVSYDTSSLLKCTVSLSYIRYYVVPQDSTASPKTTPDQNFNLTAEQLARINSQAFNPNVDLSSVLGNTTTTGGINFNSAGSSGNSINVQDTYSGNFNLNV